MSKGKKILIGILIAAAAAAALFVYFAVIPGMRTFSDGTTINGTDVSGMNLAQAKAALRDRYQGYSLKIDFVNETEYISGDDISLELNDNANLKTLLDAQENGTAGSNQFIVEDLYSFDTAKLGELISGYPALNEDNMTEGEDGQLSYNTDKGEFEIIGGSAGTVLDAVEVKSAVADAIAELSPELNISAAGLYSGGSIAADSKTGQDLVDTANKYISSNLVYTFNDGETETINKDVISQWVVVSNEDQAVLDQDRVQSTINDMVDNHSDETVTTDFKTTAGNTITLTVASATNSVDVTSFYNDVTEKVTAGESGEYDVPYTSEDESEYADNFHGSYIEIDLDNQVCYLYKDGSLVDSSSIVSGSVVSSHMTPDGVFRVYSMSRDVTLVGTGYESFVNYWMPFYGSDGLHDASWRSSFGGDIYLRNGSHGCVNLPSAFAAEMYETISTGYFVVIYGGVQTVSGQYVESQTSSASSSDTSSSQSSSSGSTSSGTSSQGSSSVSTSSETTAPETSAPETSAPETSAPETSAPETSAPETTE